MNPPKLVNPGLLLVVAALVGTLAVAGCGVGGDPDGRASASPTPDGPTALDVANCMRANGQPDFPDPVQDDEGNLTFPDSLGNYPVPQACATLLRNQKQIYEDQTRITPEEMAQRGRYAACMREKGVPEFPDPDEEGNFPLSDALRATEDGPVMRAAREACREYEPPSGNKPRPSPGAGS